MSENANFHPSEFVKILWLNPSGSVRFQSTCRAENIRKTIEKVRLLGVNSRYVVCPYF